MQCPFSGCFRSFIVIPSYGLLLIRITIFLTFFCLLPDGWCFALHVSDGMQREDVKDCAFGIRKVGRLAPGSHGEKALAGLARFLALRAPISTQKLQPLLELVHLRVSSSTSRYRSCMQLSTELVCPHWHREGSLWGCSFVLASFFPSAGLRVSLPKTYIFFDGRTVVNNPDLVLTGFSTAFQGPVFLSHWSYFTRHYIDEIN